MMPLRSLVPKLVVASALVYATFLSESVAAADVSVEASVDRQKVPVGEVFALTVTVRGATNVSPPVFPSVDGIRLLSSRVASRITTGTGGFQAEVNHIYELQAVKVGKVEIPPLAFRAGRTSHPTQRISVEIVEAVSPSPSATASSPPGPPDKRLFLRAFAEVTDAYVGQQVPVTIQLCWAGIRISSPRLHPIQTEGFRRVSLRDAVQTSRTIDGSRYDVVELTEVYFPLIPGRLKIGPFRITCDLLVPRQSTRRWPPSIDEFFDSDIGTFFGNFSRTPIDVTADEILLNVRPLPEEGKPPSFSGAVGNFSVVADVRPTDITPGDGVTVTMTVHGEGDLETATASLVKGSDSLRAFPPDISFHVLQNTDRLHTQKIFKQLVVVQSADVRDIPPVEFSYFNPASSEYVTVSKGPFPVNVTGADTSFLSATQSPVSKSDVSILSRGLFGIKTDVSAITLPQTGFGLSPIVLAAVLGVPLIIVSTSWIVSRKVERLRLDNAYARSLRARKGALAELNLGGDAAADTCSKVARALCGFVADKLDLPIGSVTTDSVGNVLLRSGVRGDLVDDVLEVLHECDRGRFSGRSAEPKLTGDLPNKARALIRELDKSIRKK